MSTYLTAGFLSLCFHYSSGGADKYVNSEPKFNTMDHHVFKESMPGVSMRSDLLRSDRVHGASVHEVVFVIRQRNMEELTDILHVVSDPESPNYGQHLSREKVISMTINPESRDAVLSYLSSIGSKVKSVTRGGDFIIAEAPVAVWEKSFKAEFFTLQQTLPDGQTHEVVRADAYSIPSELHTHVESVLNILEIPNGERASSRNKFAPLITKYLVTPSKLRKYYNVSSSHGSSQSTQAVFAAIGQYFSPADLRTFQASQNLTYQTAMDIGSHSSDSICITDPDTCGEANLDTQYIMSMSPGSPTTYWYTDSGFTSWLVDVSQASQVPLVLSISYGQEERYVTKATIDAFNTIAIKISAMGVTIFVASGDDGANSRRVRGGNSNFCGYQPDFPAVSPYVTAVGATSGPEYGYSSAEVAADGNSDNDITSGGGFSTYYPQPTWQKAAVTGYFSTAARLGKTHVAGYAANGRAYPDLSLAGMNYMIVIGGNKYDVSGTSASCPAVAGFFSNINAARKAIGKGPVGWINPSLYTKGSYFVNDITSGKTLCVADGTCCSTGFYATPGWDPATGLGSVNYGKMASMFVAFGSNISRSSPSMSPTPLSPSPSKAPITVAPSIYTLPMSMPLIVPLTASPTAPYTTISRGSDNSPRPTVPPALSPAEASLTAYPSMPVFSSSSSSNGESTGGNTTDDTTIAIIVGTVLAFIVVVLAAATAFLCHKRSAAQQNQNPTPPIYVTPYAVSGSPTIERDGIPEPTYVQAPNPHSLNLDTIAARSGQL